MTCRATVGLDQYTPAVHLVVCKAIFSHHESENKVELLDMLSSILETVAVGYRSTLFGAIGMRDFTKSGYERASAQFTPGVLNVDLKSKTIIVTGKILPTLFIALAKTNDRHSPRRCHCRC